MSVCIIYTTSDHAWTVDGIRGLRTCTTTPAVRLRPSPSRRIAKHEAFVEVVENAIDYSRAVIHVVQPTRAVRNVSFTGLYIVMQFDSVSVDYSYVGWTRMGWSSSRRRGRAVCWAARSLPAMNGDKMVESDWIGALAKYFVVHRYFIRSFRSCINMVEFFPYGG